MTSMSLLLTMWLPTAVTMLAAWRIFHRRPANLAPQLRALERLLGPAEHREPATVRVLPPRRPELRVVHDGEVA
ncbi:MAG: hypothetical protein JWO68_668 [Actinomycetia bacterium]|nr:hypothetical protein [Actinomycetes bacterium]